MKPLENILIIDHEREKYVSRDVIKILDMYIIKNLDNSYTVHKCNYTGSNVILIDDADLMKYLNKIAKVYKS